MTPGSAVPSGCELYLVALGSNMRHPAFGPPALVIAEACHALDAADVQVVSRSRTFATRPLGPSLRSYANAAAVVACDLAPPALLRVLQSIETGFGRTRRGQRWGRRVLDLDIILWSGGFFVGQTLRIPHPAFAKRDFVLRPAASIAPDWRDPISALSVKQLEARLTRPRPLPR